MESYYDTQIRIGKLQNARRRINKLYNSSFITFIPILLLSPVAVVLRNKNLGKIFVVCFILNFVIVLFLADRILKLEEELAPLLVKSEGIESVLNRYCQVESFDPNNNLGNKDRKLLKSFGIYPMAIGRNYLKGTIHDIPIETSYIRLGGSEGHGPEFSGQIAYLRYSKSYPGKLLIIRENTPESGLARSSLEYESLIKCILKTPKADSRIPGIFNRIDISEEFDKQWRVYASNSYLARCMLNKRSELYKRLLDSSRLSFVLYRDDNILLGGQYSFDLLEDSSQEKSAECEEAMDGLVNEAVPAVLSLEYPEVQ